MSYSIWIQDLPACIQSLDDIPDDFLPGVIGVRSDFIQRIIEVVPFADFTDPSRGLIDGSDFSIEIEMNAEQVEICNFSLWGSSVGIGLVAGIVEHLHLPALHSGGDGIFRSGDVAIDFKRWQEYRDQVAGEQVAP